MLRGLRPRQLTSDSAQASILPLHQNSKGNSAQGEGSTQCAGRSLGIDSCPEAPSSEAPHTCCDQNVCPGPHSRHPRHLYRALAEP